MLESPAFPFLVVGRINKMTFDVFRLLGSLGRNKVWLPYLVSYIFYLQAFHKSHLLKLRVAPSETAMTDVLREVSAHCLCFEILLSSPYETCSTVVIWAIDIGSFGKHCSFILIISTILWFIIVNNMENVLFSYC